MSEPDFRQMGDPLNDRLPPRRQWLQAGAPNYPLACRRTLIDSIGFALCVNDESEEPDYGNDHLARLIAIRIMAELALARSNGLNAYLFELRRAAPPTDQTGDE